MTSKYRRKKKLKRKIRGAQRHESVWADTESLKPKEVKVQQDGQVQLNADNILQLQGQIGNKAATKVIQESTGGAISIQRADELAGAKMELLLKELESVIKKYDKTKRKPKYFDRGFLDEFIQSGKLMVQTFSAPVFSERSFFKSKKLATLKRGHRITVLGIKGSWCRVKTDDGKLGWVHSGHLIPSVLGDLSTAPKVPKAGSSRLEHGGGRG